MQTLAAVFSLAAGMTTVVTVAAPTAAGTASPTAHRITWLAAGDSYASGQGLKDHSGPCARASGSSKTWAQVAQSDLQAVGMNVGVPDLVACTGADTSEFFSPQGSDPAQWTHSMGQFNLVTFSFGGDDVGFKKILEECYAKFCNDAHIRTRISQVGNAYPNFLTHVASTAVTTGGNVVVMGYPELVEDPTQWPADIADCEYGLNAERSRLIRGWAGDVNNDLGKAVATANALPAGARNHVTFTFVDPVSGNDGVSGSDPYLFEPASGSRHELCSQGPQWLNGLSVGLKSASADLLQKVTAGIVSPPTSLLSDLALSVQAQPYSFHPNQAGETAMGDLAAEVIQNLSWPFPTQSLTSVPVDVCPTQDNGTEPDVAIPQQVHLSVPVVVGPASLYVDNESSIATLAPKDWQCEGVVGADGSAGLDVVPKGNPLPDLNNPNSQLTEGISGIFPSACQSCTYDLVCPYIPSAVASQAQLDGPCPSQPPGETVTPVNANVVRFSAPPGAGATNDAGNSGNTGSAGSAVVNQTPYTELGVVWFYSGNGQTNDSAGELTCVLPASEDSICNAAFMEASMNDGRPQWINSKG